MKVYLAGVASLFVVGCSSSSDPAGSVRRPQLGTGAVLTNLGVSAIDLEGQGDLFVANVYELEQGGEDLNGDGDSDDHVQFLFDARSGEWINTGLANGRESILQTLPKPGFAASFVVLAVDEGQQGASDFNGDGDLDDFALFVFDPATRTSVQLPGAVRGTGRSLAVSDEHVAYTVFEAADGNVDRNGDGDTTDSYLTLYDVRTSEWTRFPDPVSSSVYASGDSVAVLVQENAATGDLNGDADEEDHVLHLIDAHSQGRINTGLSTGGPLGATADAWWYAVSERTQGGLDRNGNEDAMDRVFGSFDTTTATETNYAVAMGNAVPRGPAVRAYADLGGQAMLAMIDEAATGSDLNGDGTNWTACSTCSIQPSPLRSTRGSLLTRPRPAAPQFFSTVGSPSACTSAPKAAWI